MNKYARLMELAANEFAIRNDGIATMLMHELRVAAAEMEQAEPKATAVIYPPGEGLDNDLYFIPGAALPPGEYNLYPAPVPPAVPEAKTFRDCPHSYAGGYAGGPDSIWARGWNDCREAMLKDSPESATRQEVGDYDADGGEMRIAESAERMQKGGPIACTYDNPATWSRECWQDGELICSYKAELFLQEQPIPARYFFFGANIGPWKEGQIVGSKRAMESPCPKSAE